MHGRGDGLGERLGRLGDSVEVLDHEREAVRLSGLQNAEAEADEKKMMMTAMRRKKPWCA